MLTSIPTRSGPTLALVRRGGLDPPRLIEAVDARSRGASGVGSRPPGRGGVAGEGRSPAHARRTGTRHLLRVITGHTRGPDWFKSSMAHCTRPPSRAALLRYYFLALRTALRADTRSGALRGRFNRPLRLDVDIHPYTLRADTRSGALRGRFNRPLRLDAGAPTPSGPTLALVRAGVIRRR